MHDCYIAFVTCSIGYGCNTNTAEGLRINIRLEVGIWKEEGGVDKM